MDTREYVTLQIERTRGQLRAAAFIRPHRSSLKLQGKVLSALIADLAAVGRRPVELINASETAAEETVALPGDIVAVENAFSDDSGVIWEGTGICFRTRAGAVVSPDQFEYLKTHELAGSQILAEPVDPGATFQSDWRKLTRMAAEARADKAKETLYLTVGALRWEQNSGKKDARTVCSPLFLIPVREETTGKGICKFKLTATAFRQNSVLRRELQKQTAVNIYEGCAEETPLTEIEGAIAAVRETVEGYIGKMQVEPEIFRLCILDSQNEGVCQAVEKHFDSIVKAPLTGILAGNTATLNTAPIESVPIYPLAADESQCRVIGHALAGESVYVAAPAGTGKSQTSVNIAANLVCHGKSVCMMSEKLAANEVFLDYAARIGLDQYCLSINSNMRTADIVRQIKSIMGVRARYVQSTAARDTLARYKSAVEDYEHFSHSIYEPLPTLQISLYDLISEAVSYPELSDTAHLQVPARHYGQVRLKLAQLESKVFSQMSEEEYNNYFQRASSNDPELDGMLDGMLLELSELGLNAGQTILRNSLGKGEAVKALLSNLARRQALRAIDEKDLGEVGNRRVSGIYKALLDTSAEMQELYGSVMRQALSARVRDFADAEFLSVLEKLKVTKVTPKELFREYGPEILSVCPIIVTTPTAATNYIYDTGLDRFDTLIVDEASQMPIIAMLPYMDRIKQLIVFGDHMQLGITSAFMKRDEASGADVVSDAAPVDRSVLQAVQGRLPSCQLTYHYRSHTEMLIHVSNRTCYDGMLQVVPDVHVDRSALPPHMGLELIRVEEPELNKKGANITEAVEIAARVARLKGEMPERSIGIIAFNEAQQDLICDMLEERLGRYTDGDMLWVRSLENAQGKEADFVFVSIGHCRKNADGTLHKGISEINRAGGENRLNVLFTRARFKNFIVLSFDYNELKRSENPGIRRLYAYLDYAATGSLNEVSRSLLTNADHAITRRVSELICGAGTALYATPRIGTANLSVDVALRQRDEARYLLGLLLPGFEQSHRETVTKLTVLERAGWRVLPLSPVYFLTAPGLFASQLKRRTAQSPTFTGESTVAFDTERRPEVLFTVKQLGIDADREIEAQLTPITPDDFLAMDFEGAYRGILPDDLFEKGQGQLHAMAREGNTEANLLLLIRLREKFFSEDNRRALLSNISKLYITQKEKKACFLFAQLLRVEDIGSNAKLIRNLLKEAYQLGIGGTEDAE